MSKPQKTNAQKAFSAVISLVFRKSWSILLNLWVVGVLSRILTKEDFGLVAVSLALTAFVTNAATGGIGDFFIVYKGKEDKEEIFNSCYWFNFVMGLGAVAVILGMIPLWSYLYKDPRIPQMIGWLSIIVFAEIGSSVVKAGYKKHLNYSKMITIQTVFNTLMNIGKVWMVTSDLFSVETKVLSMVIPQAISSLAMNFFLRWYSPYKVKLGHWGISHWKEIFGFTKFVAGNGFLNRLNSEGDALVVGKIMGLGDLGIYNISNQNSNFFTKNILPIFQEITLPVFALHNDKPDVVREKFLGMITVLSFVSMPFCLGLMAISERIMPIYLGPKIGYDVVIPLQILLLNALTRSINSPTAGLFNAMRKPELGFKFNLFFVPIHLVAFLLIGNYFGVVGACWYFTITRIGSRIYLTNKALNLIHSNFKQLFQAIGPMFVASLVSGIVTWVISTQLLPYSMDSTLGLIWITLILCMTLFLSIRWIGKPNLESMIGYVAKAKPGLGKNMKRVFFLR
jgi:O-antigen/teichoic acid export membrane protein